MCLNYLKVAVEYKVVAADYHSIKYQNIKTPVRFELFGKLFSYYYWAMSSNHSRTYIGNRDVVYL